ncbi:snake venom 5'-nucleotidase-like [Parasteatoda tepidariorum]|uniref:snake venom 5'-nucleotidase-like n=1 Tax=Parasteatoda tepidariorum TaxID=114398 RepID=UPI001C721881|nr:snake venom 5'-nucleotidase-like [Parasteatoda tepidariorum]
MHFFIFLLVFAGTFRNIQSEYNLTIVHISDFHSHWFEFNEHENICSHQESKEGNCFGGFARLLTKVRELREKEKNILVLSSGEFFYGSSHHTLHGWKIASLLLSKLKLDAMSLSNHDFGRGILELSAFLYKLDFPVLCANMQATKSSFLHSRINKSIVLNVNDEKIGIIGYLHPHAIKKSRPAVSVEILPELPIIEEEVEKLQNKGVNKIIALGHSGYYTDLKIAKQVTGVDIVVGGNSDIVMEKPSELQKEYPRVTLNEVNQKTLVLHVPQHGKYIGVLRITFDEMGNVIAEDGQQVLLDSHVPQDEETLIFLRNASQLLDELAEDYRIPDRDEVLATVKVTLDGKPRSCRMNECTLGNFVADAILHRVNRNDNIDAVVINSGMIRYSIQAGNVTARDLTHALFLGDLLDTVQMNGSELREMMEHSVEEYDITGITASGAFLQISGLRVVYDLNKPPNHRVKSLMIRSDPSYTEVKSSNHYRVVMPSFLRKGNDGFKSYLKADNNTFGEDDVTLLIQYMKEFEIIKPMIDKRISFYNQEPDHPTDENEGTRKYPHNEFKLSTIFGIISPLLSDLERSFLESVIIETEKEETIPSIDALEAYLKVRVKHFLKVETISVGSHDDIMTNYRDGRAAGTRDTISESVINGTNEKQTFLTDPDHADSMSKNTYATAETSSIRPSTEDVKDAQSIHELLLHSLVQSIIEKVKEKVQLV